VLQASHHTIDGLKTALQRYPLLRTLTGERYPPVKGRRTAFAATAGLNAESIGHSLDGVAEPDLLISDESRQAHPVGLVMTLLRRIPRGSLSLHSLDLPYTP
jgi:hypothetical protein